jgi:hypothetical protein
MSVLIFDAESVAMDGAADFMESAVAPANYRDPAVIAAYIEKANAEQLAKAALDVDLARIVAIGVSDGIAGPLVYLATNEDEERAILTDFWRLVTVQPRPTLIGYNCLAYDLPLLLRRSLYLSVKTPVLQIGKYRHDGIEDLMIRLSFDGALRYRGLQFFARRFGLDVPADPHSGSDIAGLVAAGDFDAVAAHCRCDILTTVALAKRLGVL